MDTTATNATTPTARPASQVQATSSKSQISSDFQTFLKMLTAQIQNQDPLRPTPSDEFAVQLATFSSVEQQVRTNELLTALGAQFGAAGMGQYAGWVGMEAKAPVPAQFRGAPLTLVPQPAAGADRTQLVVRDAGGREIERLDIPVSEEPITWDGRDDFGAPYPEGVYSFELVSFTDGMPMTSSPVHTYGRVIEARAENGKTMIVFEGGAEVAAAEVTALRVAGGP